MTNNFKLIENYMIEEGIPFTHDKAGDKFFSIMLIRRGKDHPGLPSANYTFKSYYIDSIEKFQRVEEEIVQCCNMFRLRAYVSVNVKSKETYSKLCAAKFTHNILNNEYKKPWAVIDHAFGKCPSCNNKTWIIDVDDTNIESNIINEVIATILRCRSGYPNPVIKKIPTKSGVHILTRPFNLQEFMTFWKNEQTIECPEIKKDHITLLYENLNNE